MINFNNLPGSKPNNTFADGCYIATIETAEMKQGKDDSKPKYLNIRMGLTEANGKTVGKLFDLFTESASELPQFKLRRFIEALAVPITGEFELKDLVKIIIGKKFLIDVCAEKRDGKETGRMATDVSTADIYYSMAEASRKLEGMVAAVQNNTAPATTGADTQPY